MNALVCVKRVPEVSGQAVLTDDAQSVDGRYVGFTISDHESCAIEIAVQQAEATGGSATVFTLGPADAAEQLRGALALGCGAAVHVVGETSEFGPADVAREIAEVAREGSYDVILLGNDAADSGDFQVGIRLAYELGVPVVAGASTVEVSDDGLTVHVDGPDGAETYELPAGAVVTVLEGGVEPRYPTIKGRMAAKKIAIDERKPLHDPAGAKRVQLTLPPPAPTSVEVLGQGPEAAAAVVDLFQRLGVVR